MILAAALVAGCARASEVGFDGERAVELVEAQVGFGPRFPGSPGHAQVQAWIVEEAERLGWATERLSFEYRGATLTNIEATLDEAMGDFLILGAHYDTRRLAERDPTAPDRPAPGANDGGSGVAVLLELARVLADDRVGCDVSLVFFDGEDNGNLDGWEWAVGSRHYAHSLGRTPAAVVIVDMVGDRDLRLPIERNSSPDLAAEVWNTAAALGHAAFVREPGPSVLDDHTAFLERGFRAVDIIDLDYDAWHTTGDTLDQVSAESMEQVGSTLLAWLRSVCGDVS